MSQLQKAATNSITAIEEVLKKITNYEPVCQTSVSQEALTRFALSDLLEKERPFLLAALLILGDKGFPTVGLYYLVCFIDQQLKEDGDKSLEMALMEKTVNLLIQEKNWMALKTLRGHLNRLSVHCPELRERFFSLCSCISLTERDFG